MNRDVEIRTAMSEKIKEQKMRESRLYETKLRHESDMENSNKELSGKLDQINHRVLIKIIFQRLQKRKKKIIRISYLITKHDQSKERTNMKMS